MSHLKIYKVKDQDFVAKVYGRLHKGELEVIIDGKELGADIVIIDEISARNFAEALMLKPLGILGILKLAKAKGIIQEIKPLIDILVSKKFRISNKLVHQILKEVGEESEWEEWAMDREQVREALIEWETLSANKENRVIYEAKAKELRDLLSNFEGERRVGKEEGRNEGIKEGILNGKQEITLKILEDGYDVAIISGITELSEQEILQLRNHN